MATSKSSPCRILLIEDDEAFAEVLAYGLEQKLGANVFIATSSFEAENLMATHGFDLVVTDWRLPDLTGFAALRAADRHLAIDPEAPTDWFERQKTPVIVVTACDSSEIERERRLKGRFHFLGVVSKAQKLDSVLDSIQTVYGNAPGLPGATATA